MTTQYKKSKGRGLGVFRVIWNSGLSYVAPERSVRRLVSDLRSADEDTSVAAYMALVKLGPRIAPQLLGIAQTGEETTNVIRILGDQGDPSAIPALESFQLSPDPAVAEAARRSLGTLIKRRGRVS